MIYKVLCKSTGQALEFSLSSEAKRINVDFIENVENGGLVYGNVTLSEKQLFQLIGALHTLQKEVQNTVIIDRNTLKL